MRKILGVAHYTFIEIFRNKVYYVVLLFAAILLGTALLFGALGGEQKNRMIIDFGLVSIEFFALLIAVFASTTLVLEEMETRTLYLVLSRPVARYQFIVGRFLGLLGVISATYMVMALGHLGVMAIQRIPPTPYYFLSLAFSWEKIVLITGAGMALSLFATSTISAVAFTIFFWVLGHFSSELLFLATKTTQPVVMAMSKIFYYVAPNFHLMNLRDLPPVTQAGAKWLWSVAGYGLTYTTACLAVVVLLFRKKEF